MPISQASQQDKTSQILWSIALFFLGLLLFLPMLGNLHLFDWDEINFAEAAREMLVTKKYLSVQIDFWPFWEKPPLFIWLQALSMNIFGINEFAARFPNALCGSIVLPLLYNVGRGLRGHLFGLCWALCYVGSFLPHFYFRSGIIDPFFNAFMFVSLVFLAKAHEVGARFPLRHVAAAGFFAGLAVLTKGPVALIIVGGSWSAVWFWNTLTTSKEQGKLRLPDVLGSLTGSLPWFQVIIFLLALSLASLGWFAAITIQDGGFFVSEFLKYQVRLLQTQDAGHGGPVYFHAVAILLGCFPASFLLFDLRKHTVKEILQKNSFGRWMMVAGPFVLLLFSLVQTKIVHYSSMTYYPLTFFAALVTERFVVGKQRPSRLFSTSFFAFIIILSALLAAIPFVGVFAEKIAPLLRDATARSALLEQSAEWSTAQTLVAVPLLVLIFVASLLWKKGKTLASISCVAAGMSCLILSISAFLAPSVEEVAQGPLIRFAQTAAQRGCDVDVIGHKSFIQLFYGQRMPDSTSEDGSRLQTSKPETRWDERMQRLTGPWKKPLVLMAKTRNLEEVLAENPVKIITQKQGFAYLYRPAEGISDKIASCGFITE